MGKSRDNRKQDTTTVKTPSPESKSMLPWPWNILLVIAIIGGLYMLRVKPEKLSYRWGSKVMLHIPASAPAGFERLTATLVKDASELPGIDKNNPPFSIANFGPDGSTFPEGIEVTWPLNKHQDIGKYHQLSITSFDEKKQRWYWTGEYAQLDPGRKTAMRRARRWSLRSSKTCASTG